MFTLKVYNCRKKSHFRQGSGHRSPVEILSQTPMYVTMANPASQESPKNFLSPESWNFNNFFTKTQYLGEQSLNARKIFKKFQVL